MVNRRSENSRACLERSQGEDSLRDLSMLRVYTAEVTKMGLLVKSKQSGSRALRVSCMLGEDEGRRKAPNLGRKERCVVLSNRRGYQHVLCVSDESVRTGSERQRVRVYYVNGVPGYINGDHIFALGGDKHETTCSWYEVGTR